jgi:hypothetical protein
MLPLSLPSAYGAYGFDGYDPMIEYRPETCAFQEKFAASPAEAGRAYGIRWVLVANPDHYAKEWEYWWAVNKTRWCIESLGSWKSSSEESAYSESAWPDYQKRFLPAAKLCVHREEVSLYELPDPAPMAFDRASPQAPLGIEFHGWGAEVNVPGTGQRTVVVNIAERPWLRAASGTQLLESSGDEWGRMEVSVPDGVTQFRVFNQLPWRRGILAAVGLAAATLAGMVLIRKQF